MKALLRHLEDIKQLVERLRELNDKRELCEEILELIEEIEAVLEANEEDELKAFRLLIVLIEQLKFLGEKVPLLDTFLELYIAALKSALFVIDEFVKKHGWLHQTCMTYCRLRAEQERLLREEGGEEDEELIARRSHDSAMIGIGFFQYEKYQDRFREQYVDYVKKLELERLLEQAESFDTSSSPDDEPTDVGGSTGPAPEPATDWERLHSRLLAWIEFGRQMAERAAELQRRLERDDLTPAERRELERELERIKDIIRRLFG